MASVANQLDGLKKALLASSTPVSGTLRETLIQLFITHFVDVMRSHPGYALETRYKSLQTTLDLFVRAKSDLITALDEFDRLSRSDEFLPRTNSMRIAVQDKIRKELYCFSSLAHSLQDHCRGLRKNWTWECSFACYFGDDGLHDFMCCLRNVMHHSRMAEAEWSLKGSGQSMTSHYELKKAELIDVDDGWNANAKKFLARDAKTYDVRGLCLTYADRVQAFYDELFSAFSKDVPPQVQDFRSIWNAQHARSARDNWRFLLYEFLRRRVDPYQHLGKFLNERELEAASAFPQRSTEQVDFIIGKIDVRDACTDDIRRGAYKLFKVAGYFVPDEKERPDDAIEIFIPLDGE